MINTGILFRALLGIIKMIKIIKNGNLLDSDATAIVNTVNCVGVSGKGVALEFKKKYPKETLIYKKACHQDIVKTGKMFPVPIKNNRWIINFPTKQHWRNESKIEWIETGLDDLRQLLISTEFESIAIPPLGCGCGKLDWNIVKPLIIKKLSDLDTIIYLYEPLK